MSARRHGGAATRIVLALATLALVSCQGGSIAVEHEDHGFVDGEDVDLGADPWRTRRRMDIDQLDASIRAATGGIGWEDWRGSPPTLRARYFDTYADTLGVPDYVNGTSEDLTTSLLFVKFLDDAARSVCRRAVNREAGAGAPQDGEAIGLFAPVDVLEPAPEALDVRTTLSRLLLRFHGRSLAPSAPELEPWVELYATLAAAAPAEEAPRAWEAVCVTLITHPDFYTY